MATFAEPQVDWRHADEGHQFDNLFTRGRDRCSVVAYNSTVKRIVSPRNQRGVTAMMTFGRAVASVHVVNREEKKQAVKVLLDQTRWFWKNHVCDDDIHAAQ